MTSPLTQGRAGVVIVAAIAAMLLVATAARSASGDLDTAFGERGSVVTDIGLRSQDRCLEVLLQPDRKILCVGFTTRRGSQFEDVAVARYLRNGDLDRSFGARGIAVYDSGASRDDVATSAVLQPNGKLVVAGVADVPGDQDLLVARFDANGRLDATFGNGGVVTTDVGTESPDLDVAGAVALQVDGSIVVAGHTGAGRADEGGQVDAVLVRYTASGALDPSFGVEGKARFTSERLDSAEAIKVLPDGRILVGLVESAAASGNLAVGRYLADGRPDETFGARGIAGSDLGLDFSDVRALVLQRDGKIVVVGNGFGGISDYIVVARYRPDGRSDASFGRSGGALTKILGSSQAGVGGFAAAVQRDGKIVVAGGQGGLLMVARYLRSGRLDPAFGGIGWVTSPVRDGLEAYASAVAVQADGRIVAAGAAGKPRRDEDFAVVRFTGRGGRSTRLVSATVRRFPRTAVVRWRTTSEVGSRTFVLYRQERGRSVRRIGAVAARGAPGRGRRYSIVDRRPRSIEIETAYWLVELKRSGRRLRYGPFAL